MNKRADGFTLIELMIVVAIAGIIALVAVPSYRDYVTRGRIPDATSTLAANRTKMEQYFQDHVTYDPNGTDPGGNAVPANICSATDTTTSQYFDFSCSAVTATAFTLQAVGKGSMAGFTYTIDQTGSKASTITATGWTGNASCWVTKKGGVC